MSRANRNRRYQTRAYKPLLKYGGTRTVPSVGYVYSIYFEQWGNYIKLHEPNQETIPMTIEAAKLSSNEPPPDDGRKPIGNRRILWYSDSSLSLVKASMVPVYWSNGLFYIQDTKLMKKEFQQCKYALSLARWSVLGIRYSNDFALLSVFADAILEHGINFEKYSQEHHDILQKLITQFFPGESLAPFRDVAQTLDISKQCWQKWKDSKVSKKNPPVYPYTGPLDETTLARRR